MRSSTKHIRGTGRLSRPRVSITPQAGPPATTAVEAGAIVCCPFSFAIEHTQALFAVLGEPRGGAAPAYALRLSIAGLFEHEVATTFLRTRDATEPGRPHDEVRFDYAASSRWLPEFHGSVRFRPSSGHTAIVLHGTYVPRFGAPGRLLDALAGRRVATGIAADVVRRLGRALERRWDDDLAAYPTRCELGSAPQRRVQPA